MYIVELVVDVKIIEFPWAMGSPFTKTFAAVKIVNVSSPSLLLLMFVKKNEKNVTTYRNSCDIIVIVKRLKKRINSVLHCISTSVCQLKFYE